MKTKTLNEKSSFYSKRKITCPLYIFLLLFISFSTPDQIVKIFFTADELPIENNNSKSF